MALKPPAFIDCTPDMSDFLTGEAISLVPDIEIFRSEPKDEADLILRLEGREHVLCYMVYLSEAVLLAAQDLKTVTYLSTGLATHVDLGAAKQLQIQIRGVKGYGDRAVAEHVVALIFDALKNVSRMDRMARRDEWGLVRGEEISGKTFGILGLGGIGRETARLVQALGAHVIAWNRTPNSSSSVPLHCLDEVLRQSDMLSIHLALNEQTAGFLDSDRLSLMKPGAVLINTARAGLVAEGALIAALKSGSIAHAGLDVFHQEPLYGNNPLRQMDNVTLTTHSAWFTSQAIGRLIHIGFEVMREQISRQSGGI